MDKYIEYNITYANMRQIVKNYFKRQGLDVNVRIYNEIDNDRFAGMVITTVKVTGKTTIAGVETNINKILTMRDLKEIVKEEFAKDEKEVNELTSNATKERKTEGYLMGEHDVEVVGNKSFTVTAKEITRNKSDNKVFEKVINK